MSRDSSHPIFDQGAAMYCLRLRQSMLCLAFCTGANTAFTDTPTLTISPQIEDLSIRHSVSMQASATPEPPATVLIYRTSPNQITPYLRQTLLVLDSLQSTSGLFPQPLQIS